MGELRKSVYVTIGNLSFCVLYLTGIHFGGELQHDGDVGQQKIKWRPVKTREIGGVTLSDVLYVMEVSICVKRPYCRFYTQEPGN